MITWGKIASREADTSTIIGARTMQQLEDNLASLSVVLSPDHLQQLDDVSSRDAIFPQRFLPFSTKIFTGGSSINAEPKQDVWDMAPQADDERY